MTDSSAGGEHVQATLGDVGESDTDAPDHGTVEETSRPTQPREAIETPTTLKETAVLSIIGVGQLLRHTALWFTTLDSSNIRYLLELLDDALIPDDNRDLPLAAFVAGTLIAALMLLLSAV